MAATRPMGLAQLRKHLDITQAAVAEALGVTQATVSALEIRTDSKVSTLRDYIETLGGRLEVIAIINGERIPIDLG